MVWHLRVDDVRFHQFRFAMAVQGQSKYEQQNPLVALGSELWSLHCPFAVDDWCSECVRRRVDGCFWQVRVRRRCHNRSVIRPHMAVAPAAGSEEGFMNIFHMKKKRKKI